MAKLEAIKARFEFEEDFREKLDSYGKLHKIFADTLEPIYMSTDGLVGFTETKARIFELTDGEEKAAEILTLKKLVLNYFQPESLYIPVYNRLEILKDNVRGNRIIEFVDKFCEASDQIQVTGISSETRYDRRNMAKTIINTLSEFIAPNIIPTYGSLIVQPPNLDAELSLAYIDEFMHFSFKPNMEEFTLEAINADMILQQPRQQQKDFGILVREVLSTGAYLEYLSIHLYNSIGSFKFKPAKIGKIYYKNAINSMLNEWRE